jgi:hypothetical protein
MFSRLTAAILTVISATCLAHPGVAHAQQEDPMVTDRPDFTESARTVAPGRFQFELGYTFTKAGDEEQHNFGELLARVGILPWLEGRLGLNSFVLLRDPAEDREGLEDLTVGFKALLRGASAGGSRAVPRLALLLGANLPTGSDDVGSSEVVPGAKLVAAWDLSDRVVIATNLGWAYGFADDQRFHQGIASLVAGYSISEPLTGYIEWYGFFPENRGGGSNHYLNGGLAWLLTPNLQLDWRVGAGLQDPDPNWFTGLGFSFRL